MILSILDIERNAPCICGSGKKYKRCCMFTLENLVRHWKSGSWAIMNNELAFYLALVCGMPKAGDEEVPSIPRIEKVLNELSQEIWEQEDEDLAENAFTKESEAFNEILFAEGFLEDFIFPPELVEEYINLVDEIMDRGAKDGDEKLYLGVCDWLGNITNEEIHQEMLAQLVGVIRNRKYNEEELRALIFALADCLESPGVNVVSEALLHRSVELYFEMTQENLVLNEEVHPQWPIKEVFIPLKAIWDIAGVGMVGVVQEQPDGLFSLTAFQLRLISRGLESIAFYSDLTREELEQKLAAMQNNYPYAEKGSLEQAAPYIWGAYVLRDRKMGAYPQYFDDCLQLIPRPQGSEEDWLDYLLEELLNPELSRILADSGISYHPDEQEAIVATVIGYSLSAPAQVLKMFERLPEQFDVKAGSGEVQWQIVYYGAEQNEAAPDNRTITALIILTGKTMFVQTPTLSRAAYTVWHLTQLLGKKIKFRSVHWRTLADFREKEEGEDSETD